MKAVIFDFDGTIMDTESMWYEVYCDVLQSNYHYSLKLEDFSKIIGTVNDVLMEQLEREIGNDFDRVTFGNEVDEEFKKRDHSVICREGILKLIRFFSENKIKLAIASSSSMKWIKTHLDQLELTSYFPIILCSDYVEKVKPDPELYIKALEQLGVDAKEAVAIEDSGHGASAAIQAGIKTYVIPNPVTSFLRFPKEVLKYESFYDLIKVLKKEEND